MEVLLITLVNKGFDQEKKCLLRYIFGRWIQIFFHNFSTIHIFCSRLNGWDLLRQDTNVCFTVGFMNN